MFKKGFIGMFNFKFKHSDLWEKKKSNDIIIVAEHKKNKQFIIPFRKFLISYQINVFF